MQAPDPVIIPGSHGIVTFATDDEESYAGFKVHWTAIDGWLFHFLLHQNDMMTPLVLYPSASFQGPCPALFAVAE